MSPEHTLLINANRFTIMRSVAAGYVHHLRNPTQAIMMAAETLGAAEVGLEEVHHLLPVIRGEIERTQGFLDSLTELFDEDRVEQRPISLQPVIERVCALGGAMRPRTGIDPTYTPQEQLPAVRGTEPDIMLILLNLVSNAKYATQDGAGSAIEIATRIEGGSVVTGVYDDGSGVNPALGGDPFDPFVTDRPEAVGIGLAASRIVASGIGARLELRPGETRGTCAELALAAWVND